jgi:branched-chain amino acid transport system ATP-binding protein
MNSTPIRVSTIGRDSQIESEPLIEAVNLSAGYGNVPMVRNLNITVSAGEVVALLGANGAGKSTTLLALSGWLKPQEGEVKWKGVRTTAFLDRRARMGTSLITETRSVFTKLSVEGNLRVGRASKVIALELFPELEPLLKRSAGVLSGGEQQILTLARALARKPELLLADELSLGLAPIVVQRLMDAVRRAADDGLGVLLVEQHAHLALEVADRAYVLRRGIIQFQGSGADLYDRFDEIRGSYLSNPDSGS